MTFSIFNILKNKRKQKFNSETKQSEYEKIRVFKNLPKEKWKPSFNELNKIIGKNLKEYGFKKKGRKHYRLTNDLLEIIDIDNRGSWTGATKEIEIRIGLVPYCWEGLVNEYYLIGSKSIEELDYTIRKHFSISDKYLILAEYLSDKLIKFALPFFEKYNSTKKIISKPYIFSHNRKENGNLFYKSHLLILFSELKQHKVNKSIEILKNEIEFYKRLENCEKINKIRELKELVETKNWSEIDYLFKQNENKELKKLKIKQVANTV